MTHKQYTPIGATSREYLRISVLQMSPIYKTCTVCSKRIKLNFSRVSYCLLCGNPCCNGCIGASNSVPLDAEFPSEELICILCHDKPSRRLSQFAYEDPEEMSTNIIKDLFIDISKCNNTRKPLIPARLESVLASFEEAQDEK